MNNLKILCVIMKWDYGDPSRGIFGDYYAFGRSLESIVKNVDYFYFDQYWNNKSDLQNKLVDAVKNNNYDFTFFLTFKDHFSIDTLEEIKKYTKTIAWFGDDQWRFDKGNYFRVPRKGLFHKSDNYQLLAGYIGAYQLIEDKKMRHACCDVLCLGQSFQSSMRGFLSGNGNYLFNIAEVFCSTSTSQRIILLWVWL